MAIFWKAENLNASKYNNYSNYTLNTDSLYDGWDPISKTSLKYGNLYKFRDMESDHFNSASSRRHFLSSPCEQGYHAYSFSWQHYNYAGSTGLTLSLGIGARLICKIDDNDINNITNKNEKNHYFDLNNSFDHDEEDDNDDDIIINAKDSPNFLTRVRLLVLKKLTITGKGKQPYKEYEFNIS